MSRRSDHRGMRRRRFLDDRSAQALLSGRAVDSEPDLTAFVAALRAEAGAAEPSAALAELLANGFVPDTTAAPIVLPPRPSTGVRRWALQVSLGAAACVAVSLGAAANDLPAPVQTTVADVVEALTPLNVPRPAHHPSTPVIPTPQPTSEPSTQGEPSDEPTEGADDRPSGQPSEHGDDRGSDADRSGSGQGGREPSEDRTAAPRTEGGDDQPATTRPAATPSPTEQPDSHESSGSSGGGDDSGSGSHGG